MAITLLFISDMNCINCTYETQVSNQSFNKNRQLLNHCIYKYILYDRKSQNTNVIYTNIWSNLVIIIKLITLYKEHNERFEINHYSE